MRRFIVLPLVLIVTFALIAPHRARAQIVQAQTVSACGAPNNSPVVPNSYPITQDPTGKLCTASSASIAGSTSNASDAVATSSNSLPAVSWIYGFNGTTWDRLRDDGSFNLKVNCAVGCSAGSFNNNADTVATSATNGQAAAWLYGFNGTTWDRIRDDANKFISANLGDVAGVTVVTSAAGVQEVGIVGATGATLDATLAAGTAPTRGIATLGQFNSVAPTLTTGQTASLQEDSSGNLKVNVAAGSAANACASATGSAVPASGCLMAGGAAAGAGNLTGATVKAGSTTPATTDTSLVTSIYDGGSVTLGSKADTATCATSNTAMACFRQLHTDVTSPIPAGTNSIGNVGIEGVQAGVVTPMVSCGSHVFKHITTATDTLAVQGVGGQTIKICGAQNHYSGSAAQSVFLENTASVNANCSSANTQIAGLSTGNASAPSSDGFYNSLWGGLANTSGNGLCINSSGTGGVDVDIWYTQGS
jgi:hypothetical protein